MGELTQELPPVLTLMAAAQVLGISRNTAYTLASAEQFPCPVIRVGSSYRVPTAGLFALLGLDATPNPGPENR